MLHRCWQYAIWAVLALGGLAAFLGAYAYFALPDFRQVLSAQRGTAGLTVVDRNERLLKIFPDGRDRLSLWMSVDRFPASLKAAVIAAEDKRFEYHPGFDPIAIARALYVNIGSGRKVSGASTITQQVVRLLKPRPRTYRAKCIELVESVKMERQLSKKEILELYLNLAPMGGNIRGAALAARVYFDKSVDHITVAEAVVLAALPRSPSRYNPRRSWGKSLLIGEKDRILRRMARLGVITPDQFRLSLGNSVAFTVRPLPFEAPHFVDCLVRTDSEVNGTLKTSLDLRVQRAVEQVLRAHSKRLTALGIEQAGVIVASTKGPEVLALVGSLGYRETAQGFNNAAFALRGAGSTLKPFLYALALEQGYQTVTEIADTFRSYRTPNGDYLPLNSDRRSYGPVTIRSALGNSLNISAVKMLKQVRVEDFFGLLERLDLVHERAKPSEDYGLGLAIGNLEVNLFRLVQAYAVLANHGYFRPLTMVRGEKAHPGVRVVSDEAAYMVTHILADPTARLFTFGNPSYFDFGFPVAVKTGTSSNYRDSWTVAYTSEHVIGIWAGNFDGRTTGGTTGSGACGPILLDIVQFLYGGQTPRGFHRPDGVRQAEVCWMSGDLASFHCPYKTSELIISGREPYQCDLSHEGEHHYLGPHYARWLFQREAELSSGRFRLMPRHSQSLRAENDARSGVTGKFGPGSSGYYIEIISPHDADRFVFSPHRTNVIRFHAQTDRVVEHVIWLVDGMEVARTPPPYELFWNPSRGDHVVHAVTPKREATRITIHVE